MVPEKTALLLPGIMLRQQRLDQFNLMNPISAGPPERRPLIEWGTLLDPAAVRATLQGHCEKGGIQGAVLPTQFYVIATLFELPKDWTPAICNAFKERLDAILTHRTQLRKNPVQNHWTKHDWVCMIEHNTYSVEMYMWPVLNQWTVDSTMKLATDCIHAAFDEVSATYPPFPTILDYSNTNELLSRLKHHGVCHVMHPLEMEETNIVTQLLAQMAERVFWPETRARSEWLREYHRAGKKFMILNGVKLPLGVERISGNNFQYHLETWSDIEEWAADNSEKLQLGPGKFSILKSALKKMKLNRQNAYTQCMSEFFGIQLVESDIKSTGVALLMSIPKLTFQQLDHFDAQVMGVYSTLMSIGSTTKTTLFHQTDKFMEEYRRRSQKIGERDAAILQSASGMPLVEDDLHYVEANYSRLVTDSPPRQWSARTYIPGSEVSFLGLAAHCEVGNEADIPKLADNCWCKRQSVKPQYQSKSPVGVLFCKCQLFSPESKPRTVHTYVEGGKPQYKFFDQLCADPYDDRTITSYGRVQSSSAAAYIKGFRHSVHFVQLARNVLREGHTMLGFVESDREVFDYLHRYMRAARLVDLFGGDSCSVVADNLEDIVDMPLESWEEYNMRVIGDSTAVKETPTVLAEWNNPRGFKGTPIDLYLAEWDSSKFADSGSVSEMGSLDG
ncbi:hypothetical protein BDR26DRAFT_955732 [Obelidium mucronatum]|nr:hypothetical protein BDR26DRAFT_955732 [Obelidium mucronatum]